MGQKKLSMSFRTLLVQTDDEALWGYVRISAKAGAYKVSGLYVPLGIELSSGATSFGNRFFFGSPGDLVANTNRNCTRGPAGFLGIFPTAKEEQPYGIDNEKHLYVLPYEDMGLSGTRKEIAEIALERLGRQLPELVQQLTHVREDDQTQLCTNIGADYPPDLTDAIKTHNNYLRGLLSVHERYGEEGEKIRFHVVSGGLPSLGKTQ
ncbi:MAG: hypothetical protein HY832_03635 [Candidatus Aenigmarchaeota archaeon]|nr:hypothetical protein [Candidatus Aenigmarchaeota archaeon]